MKFELVKPINDACYFIYDNKKQVILEGYIQVLTIVIYRKRKKRIKVNKYIKGCLVFLGIVVSITLMLIGWVYYRMVTSNERQNQDDENCENIAFITDNPLIVIENVTVSYNAEINLILLDKNDTIEKKVVRNMANNKIEFNIPFKKFKKTNRILILTKNKNYIVSQMGYFNDGHWGMFGYLGGNCDFFYNSELAKE